MQRPHDEPSNFHSLFALTTQCCWYYWFFFFVLPLFTWLFLCNLSSRLGGSYRTNISKCVALLLNVYMPSVLLLLFAVGKWAACSNPRRHALPSYLRHQIGPRKRKIKRPIQWWGHHQSYPHHKPVRYLYLIQMYIFFHLLLFHTYLNTSVGRIFVAACFDFIASSGRCLRNGLLFCVTTAHSRTHTYSHIWNARAAWTRPCWATVGTDTFYVWYKNMKCPL